MTATPIIAQFADGLVDYYLNMLVSPAGIVAVAGFLVLAAMTLVFPRLWWAYLSVAIYFGSYGILRVYDRVPLTPPFSYFGAVSQGVTAGLLLLTLVATVRPAPLPRRRLNGGAFAALLAMQVVLAARTLVGGFEARAGGTLLVWVMLYVVFAVGMANWVYDREQLRRAIRAVAWAAGLMVVLNTAQFVISPGSVFVSGRMYGTTPNPQRLGVYLAAALPFCVWCALEGRGPWRVVYGSIGGLSLVMIAATGSRTAMLMVAVSMLVSFRAQVGRAASFAALSLIALVGGYLVLGDAVGSGFSRFAEAGNTREEIWGTLVAQFLSNPLAGVATDYAAGESSYLSLAASFGLVGLVPAAVFVGLLSAAAVRLLRARRVLGAAYGRAADLVAGFIASVVLVLFPLEAYLLGTLTDLMLILYATIAITGFLLEKAAEQAAAAAEPVAAEPQAWDDGLPPGQRLAGDVG